MSNGFETGRVDEPDSEDEALLVEWAADLAVRIRQGQPVDWTELGKQHPEQADALRRMLPAFSLMARMGGSAHRDAVRRFPATDPFVEFGCLGDYELGQEVGRGGMGVVYEGYQISLKRRVALKILPAAGALDARQLQRFQIEAQAAAALHHPNIVPVFAVGTERGVPFYAMQFIEGHTLAQVIREMRHLEGLDTAKPTKASDLTRAILCEQFSAEPEPRDNTGTPREPPELPAFTAPGWRRDSDSSSAGRQSFIRTIARFGIQTADALEHAHGRGILHRDIKPSNLMIDRSGHLWVTDFGLARVPGESSLTLTGDVLGTLRYMSPEQALGKRRILDESSDVYSLGATLYELLTLRPAFAGDDRQEVLRRIAQEEPRPPRKLNRAIPAALETIVLKAMAREPSGRYATAAALGDDLARFLDGRPILGRPVPLWQRSFAWARRRPAVAALLSLVILLACGLVGGVAAWASWLSGHNRELEIQIARADAKEREADRQQKVAQDRQLHADRHRYAASLRRAREALDARQIELAQDILHEIEPGTAAGGADFAWGYLWRYANREFTQLWGHEARVANSLISDDGSTLVTRDITGKILMWTLRPGMEPDRPRALIAASRSRDGELVPSLSPDGRYLAVAQPGLPVLHVDLFETASGQRVTRFQSEASGKLIACAFDPESRRMLLFASRPDGTQVIRSWTIAEPQSQAHVWTIEKGTYVIHDTPALGRSIAAWNGKTFRLFDPWTGALKGALDGSPIGSTESVNLFAFSDDARVLAAHTSANRVQWWEPGSGRALAGLPSSGGVRMMCISPRGTFLAVLDDRAHVTVFNPSRKEKTTLDRGTGDYSLRGGSLAFATDETLLAIVIDPIPGGIQPAEVWDLGSMRRVNVFPGRNDTDSVTFIPGSRSLVATGGTKPRIWRLDPPQLPDALRGHTDEAWSAAFSPDSKVLATGSDDTDERETIKLWDPASGSLLAGWVAHTATVASLAFSPDGRFLASSSLDSGKPENPNVQIWEVASRSLLATLLGHEGSVRSLAFSPDGKLLATACDDGSVRLWNMADRSIRAVLKGHATYAISVAFSPDSARLASGSNDATVKVWSVSSGELLSTLQHGANANAVAFSPDGSLLAAAGDDGQIKLWNHETKELTSTIFSAADQLRCLAFTRDGRYLTASGRDKVIRLWDVTTGQESLSLAGHEAQVNALAFSPDGRILASCSHDGAVKLWRAEPIEMVPSR